MESHSNYCSFVLRLFLISLVLGACATTQAPLHIKNELVVEGLSQEFRKPIQRLSMKAVLEQSGDQDKFNFRLQLPLDRTEKQATLFISGLGCNQPSELVIQLTDGQGNYKYIDFKSSILPNNPWELDLHRLSTSEESVEYQLTLNNEAHRFTLTKPTKSFQLKIQNSLLKIESMDVSLEE